ncbi:hypothetical protein LZ31DRAFT_259028 [Colletotrichum somersetense]|nr:hypothetical protein LZ31DRAFT_259028 [Colletotrichum somersetense]
MNRPPLFSFPPACSNLRLISFTPLSSSIRGRGELLLLLLLLRLLLKVKCSESNLFWHHRTIVCFRNTPPSHPFPPSFILLFQPSVDPTPLPTVQHAFRWYYCICTVRNDGAVMSSAALGGAGVSRREVLGLHFYSFLFIYFIFYHYDYNYTDRPKQGRTNSVVDDCVFMIGWFPT